jgi:hypothetical protein
LQSYARNKRLFIFARNQPFLGQFQKWPFPIWANSTVHSIPPHFQQKLSNSISQLIVVLSNATLDALIPSHYIYGLFSFFINDYIIPINFRKKIKIIY